MIYHGDLFDVLPTLGAESIDACVTDPPYELGFMNRAWDASGVANNIQTWQAVYRVLKPGGYLLAFGGTRTAHRMICAVEDAGFEIRDVLCWLYGQGFPKSLNIGKAIDKAAGATREVIGKAARSQPAKSGHHGGLTDDHIQYDEEGRFTPDVTVPATDAAKEWDGWGTALKPAMEPIVLARKPFTGTLSQNIQRYGTGALNIDACRIDSPDADLSAVQKCQTPQDGDTVTLNVPGHTQATYNDKGRWPANVILDEEAAALLDAQTGALSGGGDVTGFEPSAHTKNTYGEYERVPFQSHGDSGGASRFFYVAKPSREERDEGCYDLPMRTAGEATARKEGTDGLNSPRAGAGRTGGAHNFHPTVKPVALMTWLVKLVTPPNGVVLDPFLGSGTTGMAARYAERQFIGIEKEAEYVEIAKRRVSEANALLYGAESVTSVVTSGAVTSASPLNPTPTVTSVTPREWYDE